MSGKVWDGLQKEREAVPESVVILDTIPVNGMVTRWMDTLCKVIWGLEDV